MSSAGLSASFNILLERYAPGIDWSKLEIDSPDALAVARAMHSAIISDVHQAWRQERSSTYEKRVEEEVMKRTVATAPQGLSPSVWRHTAPKLLCMAKREVNRQDETAFNQHQLDIESDQLRAELTQNVMHKIAIAKGRPYQMRGSLKSSFGSSMGARSRFEYIEAKIRIGGSTNARTLQLAAEVKDQSKGTRMLLHDRVRAIAFKDDQELGRKRREEDSYSDLEDARSVCSSRATGTALSVLGGRESAKRSIVKGADLSTSTFRHYISKKEKGSLTQLCEAALDAALEVDSPQSAIIIDMLATSEMSGELMLGGLNLNAKSSFVLHKILPLCRHLKELHISRSAMSKEYAAMIIPMASVLPLTAISVVEADLRSEPLAFILAAFSRPTDPKITHPRLATLSRPPRSSSPAGDRPSPSPSPSSAMQSTKPHMTGMAPNWWLTLKQFDLSHNASIGDEGLSQIVPCLSKLQNLSAVKLAGIGITDNSASSIKHLLMDNKIQLLDLSSNAGLKKNAAIALASALSDEGVSNRLTDLELNLNEGLHTFISIITWSYPSWHSLERLGLAGVRLNEGDKMAMACMLKFSGSKLSLKSLDMSRAGDLTTVCGQNLMREIQTRRAESHMEIEIHGCKTEDPHTMPKSHTFHLDLTEPHDRLIVKMLAEHEVLGRRKMRFSSWTSLRIDGGADMIPLAAWSGVEHEGWLGKGLPLQGKLAVGVLPLPTLQLCEVQNSLI